MIQSKSTSAWAGARSFLKPLFVLLLLAVGFLMFAMIRGGNWAPAQLAVGVSLLATLLALWGMVALRHHRRARMLQQVASIR